MELPTKIESVLKVDADGFISCSGKDYMLSLRQHHQKDGLKILETILNVMGQRSAKAQSLKQVITNSVRFIGTDHRIFIKVKDNLALGFLKVAEKNLFYRDYFGTVKEIKPTCVLDFYVHESCQRSGIGKEIFQKFLKTEERLPEKLAYDRPSQKLISFLKKHYGLAKYIPQNNNYVIFDRYFEKISKDKSEQPPSSRPRSHIPPQEVKIEQPPKKVSQKQITQLMMMTTLQGKQTSQHKNTTSQGFPFSRPLGDNPAFRTSSNAYGSHYRHR